MAYEQVNPSASIGPKGTVRFMMPITLPTNAIDFNSAPNKHIAVRIDLVPGESIFSVNLYSVPAENDPSGTWLTGMNFDSHLSSTRDKYVVDWDWQPGEHFRVVVEAFLWSQDSQDDTA